MLQKFKLAFMVFLVAMLVLPCVSDVGAAVRQPKERQLKNGDVIETKILVFDGGRKQSAIDTLVATTEDTSQSVFVAGIHRIGLAFESSDINSGGSFHAYLDASLDGDLWTPITQAFTMTTAGADTNANIAPSLVDSFKEVRVRVKHHSNATTDSLGYEAKLHLFWQGH